MNHECETCKHTELNGCDYPCHCCAVVYPNTGFSDMWELADCEFCKGAEENQDGSDYTFSIEKMDTNPSLFAWNNYLDEGSAILINYCPMCGKKLVKE